MVFMVVDIVVRKASGERRRGAGAWDEKKFMHLLNVIVVCSSRGIG